MKIAWVIGVSGFWGRKTTLSLLRDRWQVIGLSRSQPHDLMNWALAKNDNLSWYKFDFESIHWEDSLLNLPTPQAIFNCSAVYDTSLERMLQVNVIQPTQLIEKTIVRMKANGGGKIAIFLGQNGRLGMAGLQNFSATQGALWTWAEATRRQLNQDKSTISLTLVFPQRAPSTLQKGLSQALQKSIQLKAVGTADSLVKQVLQGKKRAGRSPWLAGLATILS